MNEEIVNAEQVDTGVIKCPNCGANLSFSPEKQKLECQHCGSVIDIEAETAKLNKQKKELLGWIKGSEAKLGNPGFLAKAPPKVVEDAKTHLAEMKEKLARVEEALKSLN